MKLGSKIISTDPSAPPNLPGGDEAGEEFEDGGGESELRTLVMGAAEHGERLDRALVQTLPEFSRSHLAHVVEAGLVRVAGQVATRVSQKVRAGDPVVVELRPTPQSQAFAPQPMALAVVHEDEHLLVIDKPAGLVVHPAPGNWSGTLLNGLLARDAKARLLPRAGIVHRLDKDTSGLMVVARTRAAMDALVELIAARDVRREYLAIGHRRWEGAEARHVDAAIGRDPRNRLRMAVVDLARHGGKPARTDLQLLANAEAGCLVECRLHTGRTHQIRVHMASIGHPLVGDGLYGGAPAGAMERQALHAFRLGFVHPVTQAPLLFKAGPPNDFLALQAAWGLGYNPP